MNNPPPLFAARSVTKSFRGLTALSGINFKIAKGETLGLIGPNGAGKTTLISLISGTLFPTQGTLHFEDKRIDSLPAYRRARLGISRTFQLMKPFAGLSVLDNVAVGALFGTGGGQSDRAQAREQAREWLDFTGLGRHVDQPAESLGGPDRKRLELAKALAMRPKFLLLDEVMAGLNPVEIDQVIELIKKIGAQGVTMLVVEHVIKAVRQLSDRLLVIHHGQQIAEGKPNEVLEMPEVVEAYLGKRRAWARP